MPKIFVSYSRKDDQFVAELTAGLEACAFEPCFDKRDIVAGEAWEKRLDDLIRAADAIVFVMTPNSVVSSNCLWELKKASHYGKKIVPVVASAAEPEGEFARLAKLNYIFFEPSKNTFARGLCELAAALRADVNWNRDHTRILELATRWNTRGRPAELLMRGRELAEARSWIDGRPASGAEITANQLEFIAAGESAVIAQAHEENARIALLTDAELRRVRAQRLLTQVGLVAVLLLGVAGWLYYRDALRAVETEAEMRFAREQQSAADLLHGQIESTIDTLSRQLFGKEIDFDGLSPISVALIMKYEKMTAIASHQVDDRPYWPGGTSAGITIGIGDDLGTQGEQEYRTKWKGVLSDDDLERLAVAVGKRGPEAGALLPRVQDISIPVHLAAAVFVKHTLRSTRRNELLVAFPSASQLDPLCYGALVSIVYNRGPSLDGPRRKEMHDIRTALDAGRFTEIPGLIRSMKRLWVDQFQYLQARREDEARMCELGLIQARGRAVPR